MQALRLPCNLNSISQYGLPQRRNLKRYAHMLELTTKLWYVDIYRFLQCYGDSNLHLAQQYDMLSTRPSTLCLFADWIIGSVASETWCHLVDLTCCSVYMTALQCCIQLSVLKIIQFFCFACHCLSWFFTIVCDVSVMLDRTKVNRGITVTVISVAWLSYCVCLLCLLKAKYDNCVAVSRVR